MKESVEKQFHLKPVSFINYTANKIVQRYRILNAYLIVDVRLSY